MILFLSLYNNNKKEDNKIWIINITTQANVIPLYSKQKADAF